MDAEIVSRETSDDLEKFAELLTKWNQTINLVGKGTIPDLFERHIADSLQLFRHAPAFRTWVDLGSGGGLPGLVIAIQVKHTAPDRQVVLIESDQRKCAFLRTVIRELSLNASVISKRIEDVEPMKADVVSARALAELPLLLRYCDRHLVSHGTALLLKGARWQQEHEEASRLWSYRLEAIISETNSNAAVLKIKDLRHV